MHFGCNHQLACPTPFFFIINGRSWPSKFIEFTNVKFSPFSPSNFLDFYKWSWPLAWQPFHQKGVCTHGLIKGWQYHVWHNIKYDINPSFFHYCNNVVLIAKIKPHIAKIIIPSQYPFGIILIWSLTNHSFMARFPFTKFMAFRNYTFNSQDFNSVILFIFFFISNKFQNNQIFQKLTQ